MERNNKHKKAIAKIENNKKYSLSFMKISDFSYDLCNALVVANILMN